MVTVFVLYFQKLVVGSRFSDRAHYNEFVESGSKSWALMRWRLVLGVKNTQNQAAQRPREKRPFARGRESPTLLAPQEPLSFLWASLFFLASSHPFLWVISVVIYSPLPFILLLHLSVIHAYSQVHVPSAILSGALCAAVAPIALSRDHIHIKRGQGVSCGYLIQRWRLLLGLSLPHSPMASP